MLDQDKFHLSFPVENDPPHCTTLPRYLLDRGLMPQNILPTLPDISWTAD